MRRIAPPVSGSAVPAPGAAPCTAPPEPPTPAGPAPRCRVLLAAVVFGIPKVQRPAIRHRKRTRPEKAGIAQSLFLCGQLSFGKTIRFLNRCGSSQSANKTKDRAAERNTAYASRAFVYTESVFQKAILLEYAQSKDPAFFADYRLLLTTGLHELRPFCSGFRRMLTETEKQNIGTIIAKNHCEITGLNQKDLGQHRTIPA